MYIRRGNDETRVNFTHAPDGTPLGFGYTTYYYVTNLQGDVVALLDPSGNKVVEYTYDAWGNILSITGSLANTIGKWNPLRYRGYVYDNETGLYYLQSRYYDPELARFINEDRLLSTGQAKLGDNMFAYCSNNPVVLKDDSGQLGILSWMLIGAAVGIVTKYICDVVENVMDGRKGVDALRPTGTAGEYVSSGVSGAVSAIPGAGVAVAVISDVVTPAVEQGIDYLVSGEEWDWEEYGKDTVENVVLDSVAGSVSLDMPSFIRDIKDEAKELGYKGTKQLTKYLKKEQLNIFALNALIDMDTTVAGTFISEIIAIFDE